MFVTVVAVLVVLVVVVLLVASTRPDTFRVERRANIKAEPARIFAQINDFRKWEAWSPWEKLDPELRRNYSGASEGKGAVYDWEGNSQAGQGRMEITESTPPSKLVIGIGFFKPFKAQNTVEFTLEAQGDSTTVNWAMYGPQAFPMKVMCLFMSMDNMVGKDFEKGLAGLKAVAEA